MKKIIMLKATPAKVIIFVGHHCNIFDTAVSCFRFDLVFREESGTVAESD